MSKDILLSIMSLLKLKLDELKERCESLGMDHRGLRTKDLIELIKHALEVSTVTDQHDNDDGNDNDTMMRRTRLMMKRK